MAKKELRLISGVPTPEDLYVYGKTTATTTDRMARMMEVLAAAEFEFIAKNDCIYADSASMEAVDVKRLLGENGFADSEYQVYLEYRRQWGVM